METTVIYQQILILFCVAAVGVFLRRRGVMTESGNQSLSKLVLYVTLPAMILASVGSVPAGLGAGDLLLILAAAAASYLVMGIIALVVPRLLPGKKENRGVLEFLILFANVGFMGFPVLSAVYGAEVVFTAAIFNLPMNILCFTVGVLMIAPKGTKLQAKATLSPAIVASVAAPLLYLAPFSLPELFYDGCSLLGDATVPLAMLLIGSSLGGIPLRKLWNEPKLYAVAFSRLLICPAAVWFVLRCFISDPMLLGTALILAAMPSATNATLLCIEYDGDEATASRTVCLTTLFSAVTIPLILLFLP